MASDTALTQEADAAATAVAVAKGTKFESGGLGSAAADAAAETTRVLVVDDNPTIRKILRHLFTSLQWETVEAEDGEQALKLARRHPQPHAILLDLKLAKLSGYDVCRALRADEQCQLIPIIAITALDTPEEKMRALDAGADDFLRKPINRAELTARLRALLRIHRFNQELIGAESVALALARAVAAKDGYSHSHVEQVAAYAILLGRAVGLDAAELKILKYGAILHNVGKISIPDSVLEKTGPLSPRDMALFQQHPRIGCDICASIKPLKPVLPIIRHHKEHWDGTGYPEGLRGDEIPLGAQIVGIVDAYAAMVVDRPYRKAVSHEEAIAHLRERYERKWHNPQLVELFIRCLEKQQTAAAEAAATAE